jgi:LacI family transcriptional regulator
VDIAAEMGYQPDAKIAELMAYLRTGPKDEVVDTLGYLRQLPGDNESLDDLPFRGYLPGVRRCAESMGYRLESLAVGPRHLNTTTVQRILEARQIRGVIIAPVAQPHLQLDIDWSNLAVVRLGYTTSHPHSHRVAGNAYRNMALCLQSLRKMGYRRIGLALSSYDSIRVEHQWRAAFADDSQQCSAANQVPFCNLSVDNFEKWLTKAKPQVVVAVDNAVQSSIEALGFSIPNDIAYVKVGLGPDEKRLCGIATDFERIGELAVEQLISCIHRNEFGLPLHPQTITIEGAWCHGNSCPPRRPSGQRTFP